MNHKNLISLTIISFLFIFLLSPFANAASLLIIKSISESPDPFSPNADGIEDETTISATISASGFKDNKPLKLIWKIAIRDSKNRVIKTLSEHIDIQNDSQITVSGVWNGRNRKGKLVANGIYAYRIDARIKGRKTQPAFGEITVSGVAGSSVPTLTIKDVTDAPDPFSPNRDGIDDTTDIMAKICITGFDRHIKGEDQEDRDDEESDDEQDDDDDGEDDDKRKLFLKWSLHIRDPQGRQVKRFAQTQRVDNNTEIEVTQTWDGRDFRRQIVEDGIYSYEFNARIFNIKAEPKTGEVTVRTHIQLRVSVSPDIWNIG